MPIAIVLARRALNLARVAGSAARLVHVLDRTHQVILAAKAEGVRAARNWVPDIKICCMDRGESLEDYIQQAVALEADFIQPLRKDGMPSAESVESAHRAGLKLNFCTAIDEGEVARLFELGVDFPMLDDPGIASGFIGQARPEDEAISSVPCSDTQQAREHNTGEQFRSSGAMAPRAVSNQTGWKRYPRHWLRSLMRSDRQQ